MQPITTDTNPTKPNTIAPPRVKVFENRLAPDVADDSELPAWSEQLSQTLGINNLESAGMFFNHLQSSMPNLTKNSIETFNTFIASIAELKPNDLVEVHLIAQSIVVIELIMDNLGKARDSRFPEDDIRLADRLMRAHMKLIQTLTKYRRKEQKIVVERVSISAGGQAVIGNVNGTSGTGGGYE